MILESIVFILIKKNKYQSFKSFNCSLKKINVPTDEKIPLIFAQCCKNNKWLVYNLQTEQYLIQTDNYEEALNVWKWNRLKEPEFADAINGAKGLYKTWESRIEDWAWTVLLWLPLLVIIALPLLTIFTLLFAIKFYRTQKTKYVLFFISLLIPSVFLWFLVMRFFGFSVMRP
ncbi:MAG: hypothetical protein HQK76_21130 [Desulfobacterales bacterium]|nr:hypothetical protein [Desulfobacterales bacterium]